MKLTRLVCGRCGAALSGLRTDRLFVCSNCGAGWALEESGLAPLGVQYRVHEDSLLPLPFWVVEATVHVLKRTVRNEFTVTVMRFSKEYRDGVLVDKKVETGGFYERRRFLFPAFPVDGLPEIGVKLSTSGVDFPPVVTTGEWFPDVCGGSITPQDAKALAGCVAVGQETAKTDWLADIEVVVSQVKSHLVILPCAESGQRVDVARTGVSFFAGSSPVWGDLAAYHRSRFARKSKA